MNLKEQKWRNLYENQASSEISLSLYWSLEVKDQNLH